MSNHDRKTAPFAAIITLSGLLIVIINAHALFSEIIFYSMVLVLMSIIAAITVYAFAWERITRYVRSRRIERNRKRLARAYFGDFKQLVERFVRLAEFRSLDRGMPQILDGLLKKVQSDEGRIIHSRIQTGALILQNPLDDFNRRIDNLHQSAQAGHWECIGSELLTNLVKEFENYVKLHKTLYVDFVVAMVREIGVDKVAQSVKRAYSEYRDDYNQFIISYTELADKAYVAGLWIFDKSLQKAREP